MYITIDIHVYLTWISAGDIPMIRTLMSLLPPEVGINASHHVVSYMYEVKKEKSHDNFKSEKNYMQLFVIGNRIRTIFVLSCRVLT